VSGGQKEFIKTAIDSGMLGAAETHKLVADRDHEQTGGIFIIDCEVISLRNSSDLLRIAETLVKRMCLRWIFA